MPSYDTWPIRKELDFIDLGYVLDSLVPGGTRQLGVPAAAFQLHLETKLEHIRNMRYGHQTDQCLLERLLNLQYGQRQEVQVHDVDTLGEDYVLFLHKYPHKWFLQGRWKEDFIDRRGLKMGDVIGLRWDAPNTRLNFKVLYRSEIDN